MIFNLTLDSKTFILKCDFRSKHILGIYMLFDEIVQRYFEDIYNTLIQRIGFNEHTEDGKQTKTFSVLAIGQGTNILGYLLRENSGPWVNYNSVILDEWGNDLGIDNDGNYVTEPFPTGNTFDYVLVLNTNSPTPPITHYILSEVQEKLGMKTMRWLQQEAMETKCEHEYGLLSSAATSVGEKGRLVRMGVIPDEFVDGMERLMMDFGFKLTELRRVELSDETAGRLVAYDIERVGVTLNPEKFEPIIRYYIDNFCTVVFDRIGPANKDALSLTSKGALGKYAELGDYLDTNTKFWIT